MILCDNEYVNRFYKKIFSLLNIYDILLFRGENMGINEVVKIGNRIRKFRTEKGLSQKEMATLTGIPYSTYSNYENNNREPNLQQLNKIANILGISLQNLVFQGSIYTEMDFDTDEEAALYMGVIGNLEKMNIDGIKETKHYTQYLLSNSKYTKPDDPPQD